MNVIHRLSLFLLLSTIIFSYSHEPSARDVIIETIYGTATITEPVLIDLMHSNAMQRLKNIHQYGVMRFINPEQEYTRYQHSIGVLLLMRHYGATLEEQVVGLLHDVSHTAFSHVADYLFGTVRSKESYQDQIFAWYVEQTDILPILQRYNLAWICPTEVRNQYCMLKDNLPNLCADRLEYNLYGGYLEGWLTQPDIQNILGHLTYHKGQWLFDDLASARLFAHITVELSKKIWCSDWNCFIYTESAHLLKRGLELKVITMDDLTFSTDHVVWAMLKEHPDEQLQAIITRIMHYQTHFKQGSADDYDFFVKGKFRGVDPLINNEQGIFSLSALDAEFKTYYEQTKKDLEIGWYIKYT